MTAGGGRESRSAAPLRDTIFALSSGTPPAAIAVVRISGPAADDALASLARTLPPPREARLVTLRREGAILDRALALRFPGPASATGEDVAELHLHGGRSVVAAVEAALAALPGLRVAVPGEFTRRAFENGRIDLAEAEGFADLIAAETESQRRAALALAGGALSRQVERWRSQLLGLAAQIEAVLDFSDEDDVAELPAAFAPEIAALAGEIADCLARPPAERLRDGVRVVAAGPPNCGKSTLINALAGREVAITSNIAGTTRDLIEAPVKLRGTPLLLVDTAGLRVSSDEIEAIGVGRAEAALAAADLVLWLGDPDSSPVGERAIKVQTKSDLAPADPRYQLAVSAMTGAGMNALVDQIITSARALLPCEGDFALHGRHRRLLAQASELLAEVDCSRDPLIAAELLRGARNVLDRLTGRAGVEDVLDTLFARFCIGK